MSKKHPSNDPPVKDADAPDHLSPRSQNPGSGENDVHQLHNAGAKRAKQSRHRRRSTNAMVAAWPQETPRRARKGRPEQAPDVSS
jgi:hypothetical protein